MEEKSQTQLCNYESLKIGLQNSTNDIKIQMLVLVGECENQIYEVLRRSINGVGIIN